MAKSDFRIGVEARIMKSSIDQIKAQLKEVEQEVNKSFSSSNKATAQGIKVSQKWADTHLNMGETAKRVAKELNIPAESIKKLEVNTKDYANGLVRFNTEVQSGSKHIKTYSGEFNTLDKSVKLTNAGLKEMTHSSSILKDALNNMFRFLRFYVAGGILVGFVRSIKDGVKSVIELDASLTELNKVADLTANQLQNITDRAYEMGKTIGRTGKEVIDATVEFKRAGFEIEDAFDLSKVALVLTNVGDGITDVKEASSSIIAVLKGFKMQASDAMHIIDALNETSNNFAVDTNNLTEILKRVSGTIAQTGTSYEQLIGLATAGFESLRNAQVVASGINMITQRKIFNNNAELLKVASYVQKCA